MTRAGDFQGVEAPWTLTLAQKSTRKRNQTQEDARILRRIQGGRGGWTWEMEGPMMEKYPRDRKGPEIRTRSEEGGGRGGTRDAVEDSGMQRGAQRQVDEADGWQAQKTSRWMVSRRRVCG